MTFYGSASAIRGAAAPYYSCSTEIGIAGAIFSPSLPLSLCLYTVVSVSGYFDERASHGGPHAGVSRASGGGEGAASSAPIHAEMYACRMRLAVG